MMDKIRIHLIIEGRVQGVWFRESARQEAIRKGIVGWVRNRSDGTVETIAEGPFDRIQGFVSWCEQGPPSARVDRVHQKEEVWTGEFSFFEVTF